MLWFLFLACTSSKIEPLSITLLSPKDESVFAADADIPVHAYITATDVQNVAIAWHSSIHGGLFTSDPPNEDGDLYATISGLAEGEHVLTVLVGDAEGKEAQDAITLYIGDDYSELPSLDVLHPDGTEQALENESFAFAAKVADLQDGDSDLTVSFFSGNDLLCQAISTADGLAQCSAELALGEYAITAETMDSDGHEVRVERSLLVVARADYDGDGDGYAPNQGDCDDNDPNTYAGARESCDGIDNDCDEATPIEVGSDCWDDDGDGFCEQPPCLNADESAADCDDTREQVNPQSNETPNGLDDDCDGLVDDGTFAFDDDGDGFCELPPCTNSEETRSDCSDSNPAVHPAAEEVCGDGLDNNCSGSENEQDAQGCSDFYRDEDGDTFGVAGDQKCFCEQGLAPYTGLDDSDCYDQNPEANPLQTEWFTEDRGDGSFDYDCSSVEERRWEGESNGCDAGFFSSIGLQCEPDGIGWEGGEPDCGQSGWWLDGCSSDIPLACIIICAATGDLFTCLDCGAVCTGNRDNQDQECR